MYPNLRAEMARNEVKSTAIASILSISYDSALNKINGKTDFTRSEIFKIKNVYFPDLTLEYLFHTKDLCEESEV